MLKLKKETNILEKLQFMVHCIYLSDLKFSPYKEKALSVLNAIDADDESKKYALNYIGKEVA